MIRIQKTVTLQGGGTLKLAASFDLFALSQTDRAFVFELIDRVKNFDGAKPRSPVARSRWRTKAGVVVIEGGRTTALRRGRREVKIAAHRESGAFHGWLWLNELKPVRPAPRGPVVADPRAIR